MSDTVSCVNCRSCLSQTATFPAKLQILHACAGQVASTAADTSTRLWSIQRITVVDASFVNVDTLYIHSRLREWPMPRQGQ